MYPAVVEVGRAWNFPSPLLANMTWRMRVSTGRTPQQRPLRSLHRICLLCGFCNSHVMFAEYMQTSQKKKHRSETVAAILIRWPKIPLIDFLPIPWVVHLSSSSDNWRFIKLAIPEPFQESWFSWLWLASGVWGYIPSTKKITSSQLSKEKKTRLFRVFVGDYTSQLCGDIS